MKFKIIIPLFSLIMLFIFAGCDDDIVIPQYGNDQQVSSDSSYNSNVTSFVELIGADKAKEIALNHAGVSADRIYDLEKRRGRTGLRRSRTKRNWQKITAGLYFSQ